MIKTIIRLIKGTGKFIAGRVVNQADPHVGAQGSEVLDAQVMEDLVNRSPLRVITHPIYMHYGMGLPANGQLSADAIRHTHYFFWRAEEAFERKSLPEAFKALPCHYFIIFQMPADLSLTYGAVAPWFGQPGGGTKYCIRHQDQPVALQELKRLGILSGVHYETLGPSNLDILQKRDQYVIHICKQDMDVVTHMVLDAHGQPLTLYQAIQQGKAHVLRLDHVPPSHPTI